MFCKKLLTDSETDICALCAKTVKYCGVPYASKKPYYERGYAVFHYEGNARAAILRYKFSGFKSYASFFGKEMAEKYRLSGVKADLITSPPSLANRVFKRGYDHAFLLAERLSENTGVPAVRCFKKIRKTRHMYGLTPAERRANISGSIAFFGDVSGKTVLIADDILTTGATASECARLLKENGAKEVYVIAATAKK